MWEILKQLFSPSQYIPHGHCYLWQSQLVWLHIMSDLLIAIAYFSIPATLIYFIYKRNDIPFLGVFGLFGAFIILCGTGHMLEIWTLWHPVYWLSGIEKAITALVSCYTVIEMVTLLPQFLALQTPEQLAIINGELQAQIVERQQAEQALQGTVAETAQAKSALRRAYDELEIRVMEATEGLRQRTAELVKANAALETEIQERIAAESVLRTSEARLRKQQAGLLELAKERKQAETALWQMAEREKAISRVIQQMRQTLQLQTIFSATTQELRQVLNCDRAVIYRFNPDWSGGIVSESVAQGWITLMQTQTNQPAPTESAIDQASCVVKTLGSVNEPVQDTDTYLQETQGGVCSQGTSHLCVPDIYKAGFQSCYLERLERFQAKAYIIVPIFCGKKLWGLLAAYQNLAPRQWSEAEISMMVQIGTQLGVAVQQAELLARTQQQAEELKEAKDAADAANQAKSEFLANMSHELRTPLNAILGFTQVMQRDSSLSTEQQQYLDIVSRSGKHLLELINDVLEMSKIEAGRVTLHENSFNFYRLLDSLEEMLQVVATSKGLLLSFERTDEVPQYVKTDASKLRQVLINLLGNAIKFTTKGSVTLRVSLVTGHLSLTTDREQMTIRFEVEDTGLGIAPNELNKLFKPFTQTETGVKSGVGTGLGLPISQKFVQLMGGEITVNSMRDQGSKFAFEIHVSPVEETPIETTQPVGKKVIGLAPDQPVYRILVAEDKLTNRLLLVKLLSCLGFEVREAENGQEAVAMWESWEPHLIWMDMQMPVMNGYEATKHIKASLKGQATVIIALTASVFEEQRQAILSVGCDDFVRKPFQQENLLAKISEYLGVRYIYEEKDEVGSRKVEQQNPSSPYILHPTLQEGLCPTSLQVMPTEWVEQLHHAAAQGSDLLIYQLLTQIPQSNAALAVALKDLVENFQFDRVTELAQPIKE